MDTEKTINFIWLRNDLRLQFNKSISIASQGKSPLNIIFILDPKLTDSGNTPDVRLHFMHDCLHDLDNQLKEKGSKLLLIRADPNTFWTKLSKAKTVKIFATKDYSVFSTKRDKTIRNNLSNLSEFIHTKNNVIYDFEDGIVNKEGNPFKVFTQFKIQWLKKLSEELKNRSDEFKESNLNEVNFSTTKDIEDLENKITELGFEVVDIDTLKRTDDESEFKGGELIGREKWAKFLETKIYDYGKYRNQLDLEATSKLSPYLKFGALSVYEVVRECLKIIGKDFADFRKFNGTKISGVERYLSEIIWREFYKYVLAHFPYVERGSFQQKYDKIFWNTNKDHFKAWCEGKTGYPVVDACMRQLNSIGWMHNRGRMIVGSFLCKDLHINWQAGEKYFQQKLIDHDISSNSGGWQWVAGVGTDAAPYFRIFNPIEQGLKHDPNGDFIRKWVPELKNVPNKFLYSPWLMSPLEQAEFGITIGKDYPMPIVDHKEARERTLKIYKV